jgi:hypothetical protein
MPPQVVQQQCVTRGRMEVMTSTNSDIAATQQQLGAIPTAGRGLVRLELLAVGGEAVGRERFERLVTAVVREIHPTARSIGANPGDWGIDTFVGELSRGTIAVWQSKYFLDGVGRVQQADIRDSLASLQQAANRAISRPVCAKLEEGRSTVRRVPVRRHPGGCRLRPAGDLLGRQGRQRDHDQKVGRMRGSMYSNERYWRHVLRRRPELTP